MNEEERIRLGVATAIDQADNTGQRTGMLCLKELEQRKHQLYLRKE